MSNIPDIGGITGAADRSSIRIQDNYMFDALIRAIDFFSLKFNLETLIDFAGDFINEILTLGASAVFVLNEDGDEFAVQKLRLYEGNLKTVPNSKKLQDFAVLNASIITAGFASFFPEEFLEQYKPSLLIPLVHANGLIGFIITSGKALGSFDEDDYSMAKALMRLFNNAFERNYYSTDRASLEKKLDSSVFELSATNKFSKVLFEELDLDRLMTTGVEVFAEVSGSRVTAFAIKDLENTSLVVKAFKNVHEGSPCPEDFHLYFCENPIFNKDKCIFNVDNETDALKKIFKNPERFDELGAEYVVLIVREKILGFVTLGKTKIAPKYNEGHLEIVNSLAISCYIALNNAMMYSELAKQKREIEESYRKIMNM